MVPQQLLPRPGLPMPGWGTGTTGCEVRASLARVPPQRNRRPSLGSLQRFGHSAGAHIFCYLKMTVHGTHGNKAVFSFQCFAANGPSFGADSTNKRKIKSKRRQKDAGLDPSKVASGYPKNREQLVPELKTGRENRSGKQVMDKQFLEKVEAVRRSALEKKKAEENKDYLAIDYDAPIESDKSTLGFGTRVGIGVAVVVFGLVFAFGDFLPNGRFHKISASYHISVIPHSSNCQIGYSKLPNNDIMKKTGERVSAAKAALEDCGNGINHLVSPSKESTVVKQNLSKEEEAKFKSVLEGFEATLSKSPDDPTALEGVAVSLVELGEYEKASTYLEKLVKVIPDKAEAYRLLGEVKFELKDYEGSSSSYKKALSSSENLDFDVLRGLTNSLLAAKKPDQAVEVILSCRRKLNENSQTLHTDPTDNTGDKQPQDIDPIQVDLLLGKAYSDWGHISDAVSVYDQLINEHPEDFRPYLAKGIILKENGKTGEAERMFIQAKFFAPDAAKALVDRYAQR